MADPFDAPMGARGAAGATWPELFQERVARTPDAPATVFRGQLLSYAELNASANRLARFLVSRGAGPESLVAVAVPRSTDMVVAVLGVLKAGAAYVPLDPAYPADRVAFMLADSRPVAVLTTADAARDLAGMAPRPEAQANPVPLVVLDDPVTAAAVSGLGGGDLADDERLAPLAPSSPAYVIYTSGSTGRPKGVVIEHRGLTDLMARARAQFAPEELSRTVAATTLNFDFSVFEILVTL
ncbi:MAG TPA: AMP-binding protein, partial [Streptosporangiaceae bacterium]|nr:AMP-binding protein [Streptosporangiaceae bacterium]